MATYPQDGFDNIPEDLLRVGAHRAPERKGAGWIAFAWAALATVVLVIIGMAGLSAVTGKSSLPFLSASSSATPSPTPSAIKTATPKLDPTVPITVLNGTLTTNLANSAADYLVTKGWAGAGLDVGARANATDQHIAKTVVYYTTPTDEAAARELVKNLGVGSVLLSSAFPDRITVVLGSDFKLPGS